MDTAEFDTQQAEGLAALLSLATTSPIPLVRLPEKGRHRQPGVISRHRRRFATFGVIGLVVFLAGLAVQGLLVRRGVSAAWSYVGQAVFSIELSYLLNHGITWRDRDAPLVLSWAKFNTQKILLTVPNFLIYGALVWLGTGWLVANTATTALFVGANYVLGHNWSFKSSAPPAEAPALPLVLPTVSAVVPCKNNPSTIRATVDALLGQDYVALIEVILVGDVGDPTWAALADVTDSRLTILEQEIAPGRRDPNVKRDKGLLKASGEVLALADSDIVMPSDWLSRGVAELLRQGGGVVAGGMATINDSFWGRFVDGNSLGAKTPRLPAPYVVTPDNFGQRGRKPPITANVIFTRQLYDDCPLDTEWLYGYEDYEWFWRVVQGGHRVFYDGALNGQHHHRSSFRALVREYLRAGGGCARFALAHRESPLARKRLRQAVLLPLAGLLGLVAAALSVVSGHGPLVLAAAVCTPPTLMGWEYAHSRKPESLVYPFISLPLAAIFTFGMVRMLAQTVPIPVISHRKPRERYYLIIAGAIVAGAVLRLLNLASAPDWQVDEVTYTAIARNVLHGTLNLPIAYGQPWKPFLFHPPFYFLILGRWFSLVGVGIYQARLLGVLAGTVTAVLLARLVWKAYGPLVAVVVSVFFATDGWLLYVQRVSYMENLLLVLIVGSFLAYQKALETGQWPWYLVAGGLSGCSVIFKHTGAYVLVAVLLALLIKRRDVLKHLALFGVAITITAAYVLVMMRLFDYGGHNWYVDQTFVQISRTLGRQQSGGSLSSPAQFLHLITHQYAVFLPSLLAAAAGLAVLLRDLVRCFRARSFAALGDDVVIPAWALAGVVVFGAISLKYSQYFSLVLLPIYCYLWARVVPWARENIKTKTAIVAVAVVAAIGVVSFQARAASSPGNVFQTAGQYVSTHLPHSAVVVAETPIDYEIPQRWCSPNGWRISPLCLESAQYIVTWQTYLQSSNPYKFTAFATLLRRSVRIKTFAGFNGIATVWRVSGR